MLGEKSNVSVWRVNETSAREVEDAMGRSSSEAGRYGLQFKDGIGCLLGLDLGPCSLLAG